MLDFPRMFITLIIISFAVHRVTFILINDEGPADIVIKFKKFLGYDEGGVMLDRPAPILVLAKLFECFYCMSVWTSLGGLGLGMLAGWIVPASLSDVLLYWFGIAGFVYFLEYKIVEGQ